MTTKVAEKPKANVVQGDDPPAPEVMAQAIVDIAEAMRKVTPT